MLYSLAAGVVLLIHLGFILFAVLGAALAVRWRWVPWVHLPAVAWAFLVEVSGGMCPLTSLENDFQAGAGQSGYAEGFIEHYLLPLIYPDGLTRATQFWLAGVVVATNGALYGWLLWRWRTARARAASRVV